MKRFQRKNFFKTAIVGSLVVLFTTAPNIASAQLFSIGNIAEKAVIGVFKFVVFIVNFIGAALFTVAAWLLNLMIDLNLTVLDGSNTLVHLGWQLVRDMANLGFVLVIIIIAFATILRFEQYGVTKLLPKLIAAAIIVNFSFAIASVFINFTNVLTTFFAERAISSDTRGVIDLSSGLAEAFGPQRFFLEGSEEAEGIDEATEFTSAALTSITSLIFIFIFTLIGAFVIGAMAIMFFLRYLYLTFLVIISPIIWLFWVIPALKGQFGKWWNNFLKWSFFAPASMFFVYLALISISGLSDKIFEYKDTGSGIPSFFSGVLQNVMIQGTQMIVLSGILIGGLIISEKMSITGASGAMKIAGTVGKAGQAWVGRQALRAGSAPFRTAPGQATVKALQKFGTGTGGGRWAKGFRAAGKFTGVNALTRTVGNTLSNVGVVQGEGLVKDAEKRQAGLSDDQLAIRVAGMNDFERIAALTRLAKAKKLDKVPEVDSYIADSNTSAIFEKFGKKDSYQDVEKARGVNTAMLNAEGETQMATAAAEFYKTFSPKDFAKVQFGDIFAQFDNEKSQFGKNEGDHGAIQKAVAYGMAVNNPGDVRKIFVNVKSTDLETAGRAVASTIDSVDPGLAPKIREVLDKTLMQRGRGELFDFAPPPGATPGTTTT